MREAAEVLVDIWRAWVEIRKLIIEGRECNSNKLKQRCY